jgi:phosphoribosylformylglycinamidine synthase
MRFGIIRFPGSTCEQDVAHAVTCLGQEFTYIWHQESTLGNVDAVILPGGLSFGDYLRPGAVAKLSPIMEAVARFADEGGAVMGICNGFQILTEAHLLPGALIRNSKLKFICKTVPLRVDASCDWLNQPVGTVLTLPISHGEGSFVCDQDTLARLRDNDQIVLRYCTDDGDDLRQAPNGSIDNIAGICNKQRNVFGLMPHPDHAVDPICGDTDGVSFFAPFIKHVDAVVKASV